MPQLQSRWLQISLIFFIFLFIPFFVLSSQAGPRSDRILIRLSDTTVSRQMPDAVFLHDQHTQALTDADCRKCHLKDKNRFIFKFNRIKDSSYEADKALYHNTCIGCHEEKNAQKTASGPQAGECRSCHSTSGRYTQAARPFGFNKSLHYRHVISESIPPSDKDVNNQNCSTCHHEYEQTLKKTVYIPGKESTCRYCHKSKTSDEIRDFKTAAHTDCLNCHIRLKSKKINTGPTDCFRCHDAANQSKIEALDNIPRIRRNQPDAALLSLWLKEAMDSGKPSSQFMNPVAFNHKSHEATNESCYVCHHASLDACSSCHTRLGTEKSHFVSLETAMHASSAMAGCIGCHNAKQKQPDCAGCHFQTGPETFSETRCKRCHRINKTSLTPTPTDDKALLQIAESAVTAQTKAWQQVLDEKIPETVTIDIMKKQYDAAIFPHRKIIRTIYERIQKSKLASYFHENEATLCTGCHHHSPISTTPPKCASCHGISSKPPADGRPGLKGAYHGQCIGCHQEMGIQKPAARDCASCHQLQTKTGQDSD